MTSALSVLLKQNVKKGSKKQNMLQKNKIKNKQRSCNNMKKTCRHFPQSLSQKTLLSPCEPNTE